MIDTVKLKSPPLSWEMHTALEQSMQRRMLYQIATGEVEWHLTTQDLKGSWENKISCRLMTQEVVTTAWTVKDKYHGNVRKSSTTMQDCDPYLLVEGSVHKALSGHNISGGPVDWLPTMRWFISHLGNLLSAELPAADGWRVERVDWTETFELDPKAIGELIWTMGNVTYPRRKVRPYGRETVMWPGTTTALKIYHKGPEFYVHGRRDLRAVKSQEEIFLLQQRANDIMRVELGIRSKKLQADFGHRPAVSEVSREYLEQAFDAEVGKVLREGQAGMETVRHTISVESRLQSMYGDELGTTLFGMWSKLCTLEEKAVRSGMKQRTWYWRRKKLIDAGVTWAGSDLKIETEGLVPTAFMCRRQDSRCRRSEDEDVRALIAPYRVAV